MTRITNARFEEYTNQIEATVWKDRRGWSGATLPKTAFK